MRHRITFHRVEEITVDVDGFPNDEAARIQSEATPMLVANEGIVFEDWHAPAMNPMRVVSVERIAE